MTRVEQFELIHAHMEKDAIDWAAMGNTAAKYWKPVASYGGKFMNALPVVGNVLSGVQGATNLAKGNFGSAALDFAGMIPGIGNWVNVARMGYGLGQAMPGKMAAFDSGIDQYCKEAGFDDDDKRAVYALLVKAAEDPDPTGTFGGALYNGGQAVSRAAGDIPGGWWNLLGPAAWAVNGARLLGRGTEAISKDYYTAQNQAAAAKDKQQMVRDQKTNGTFGNVQKARTQMLASEARRMVMERFNSGREFGLTEQEALRDATRGMGRRGRGLRRQFMSNRNLFSNPDASGVTGGVGGAGTHVTPGGSFDPNAPMTPQAPASTGPAPSGLEMPGSGSGGGMSAPATPPAMPAGKPDTTFSDAGAEWAKQLSSGAGSMEPPSTPAPAATPPPSTPPAMAVNTPKMSLTPGG